MEHRCPIEVRVAGVKPLIKVKTIVHHVNSNLNRTGRYSELGEGVTKIFGTDMSA